MTTGLGAYGHVLRDREARAFSLSGLVARMPMSMTGLGVVLLVSLETGSYGRAGLVAAAGTLSGAVAAPVWGRLIDRIGQARVLVSAALLNTVSVAVLVLTVLADLPLGTSLLAAAGVGLGFSSAGACVRARWSHRLAGDPLLHTAFAVEAMLDEVVFIVGPVLATFLATSVHPALGLLACLVLGLSGALLLARQRSTQPPYGRPPRHQARHEPLPVGPLVALALASAAIGSLFGGMEVAVVAFAEAAGAVELSGVLLLTWAVGSLASGMVVGTVAWRSSPARRFRTSAILLALSTLPLPFVQRPLLLVPVLVVSGLAIAPTMIASVAVAQSAVSPARLTEAFGWTSMGLAGGVALGAAGMGRLIDSGGPTAGFWGLVAAGVVLIGLTLLVRSGPAQPGDSDPGYPVVLPGAQSHPSDGAFTDDGSTSAAVGSRRRAAAPAPPAG
ncbi:MAG: putative drug resistance transporter [Friedmanniella sp.]|nr:putative drug resistance transporter [Friedmanniella sp.]